MDMRHLAPLLAILLAGCAHAPAAIGIIHPPTGSTGFAAQAASARRTAAIQAFVKHRFDVEIDANHDGKATPTEWERSSIVVSPFKDADRDHDGAIDLAEYGAFEQNAIENETREHEGGFKILLSQADRNHDGKIGGKELVYKPNGKKTYDYRPIDFNGDGELTVDEYVDASWNLSAGLEPIPPL